MEVLLRVAPGVRLVVTSQAPLHAAGEHRYRLGVLDVPAGPVGVGDALRAGAVALFVERARAADARFVLTDANVAAVVEVCRRLDGLPLAIELAAARAPALGFHRLAASMNDRLAFLGAAHGASAPDRQRTLRATLDWSHSLLGDIEQAVFRRMAVVAGSASMEFIQEVASDDPGGAIDRLVVLDALCVLVERSLVSIVEVAGTELPRYALLESPRVYALEQLTQRGELERTQCRHVQACVQAVGLLGDALESGGLGLEEWRRRLTPDVANSRDAMAHAGLLGDVDSAARIGMALVRALPKSMFAERMAIGDTLSELLGSHVSEGLKLRGWIELAKLWSNTSRQDRARALWERALAAARSMDPVPESRVLLHAALAGSVYAAASIGDVDGATERHEEMRALEDPAWPPGRLVVGLQAAKYLANARGDAGERLQLARRMHATMVAAGMDENVGILNMVNAQIFAGRAEAAVETATALVGVLTAGRDEFTLCVARNTLVSALLETADVARARNEARPGWEAAMRFDLWTKWMDMLSLLCALELRPRSAALLLGMVMAHPEAAVGDPEEAARCERIGRLSLSALGEDAFSALLQQGAALRIDEVSELAFGLVDAVDVVT